jgi:predicted metal-dependent hydrolase
LSCLASALSHPESLKSLKRRRYKGRARQQLHALAHDQMFLSVCPDSHARKRQAIMEEWYREQVKEAVSPLIAKWGPVMGVKVERFCVRRMNTRWGSCTPRTRRIRLNTELAKKSPEFLEYVVLHEMVHLIERHHNGRFARLMDKHLPDWRHLRKTLNSASPKHTTGSGGESLRS